MNPNRQRAGLARAQALTPQRREEIAQKAAKSRWEKKKAGDVPATLEQDQVKPSAVSAGSKPASVARLRKQSI